MADIRLTAEPILGTDTEIGGNRIRERSDLALVSVAIPQGGEKALLKPLGGHWGLDMPQPTRATRSGETWALRTGADQLMLIFPHTEPDAERIVRDSLKGAGYTTDQTDAWLVLDLSGPGTRAALERVCPIDLHPDAFPVGAFARTVMEHMGAVILRTGDDSYLLLSASSSAGSFLHAIETSFDYTAA